VTKAQRAVRALTMTEAYLTGKYTRDPYTTAHAHTLEVVREALVALSVPDKPDLAALNAAVAEAVEEYDKIMYRFSGPVRDALDARRAAMKPRPRYEALPTAHTVMLDYHTGEQLNALQVAALLNAKEPKP
jgi:hypothetical protein